MHEKYHFGLKRIPCAGAQLSQLDSYGLASEKIVSMMSRPKCAIYTRLSKEDEDKQQPESESIDRKSVV